jgi:tetratricopeptide (TPR) repeat protein
MGEALKPGASRLERLQEMATRNPGDPFPRYALALEYRDLGRLEEAEAWLRPLLAPPVEYVPAFLQLGMLLVDQERTDAAREVLIQGVQAAGRKGDRRAEAEMQALLDEIE